MHFCGTTYSCTSFPYRSARFFSLLHLLCTYSSVRIITFLRKPAHHSYTAVPEYLLSFGTVSFIIHVNILLPHLLHQQFRRPLQNNRSPSLLHLVCPCFITRHHLLHSSLKLTCFLAPLNYSYLSYSTISQSFSSPISLCIIICYPTSRSTHR